MGTTSLKIEDRAWLACAIDSEGWISRLMCSSINPCAGCPHVRLGIANTNKEYMERVRELFGCGEIKVWKAQLAKTPSGKAQYQLRIFKKEDIKRILEAVLPYLIVKRAEAKEALGRLDNLGR